MTAVAQPRGFGFPGAVASAPGGLKQRAAIAWNQPEPWTVALLLVTGVVIIGRHPLAKMLGTETADGDVTPSVIATAPAIPSAAPSKAAADAANLSTLPTHAPRDPFAALATATGKLLAPGAIDTAAPTTGATTGTATHTHRQSTATPTHAKPSQPSGGSVSGVGATCTGTVHTVSAGETLWSIAASAVKSTDAGKVTIAWHRLYNANRPPLGSNPGLVPVGAQLCVPHSL